MRPQWPHDLRLRLLIWVGNILCPTDTQSLILLQRFEAMDLMKLPWDGTLSASLYVYTSEKLTRT